MIVRVRTFILNVFDVLYCTENSVDIQIRVELSKRWTQNQNPLSFEVGIRSSVR
jgi:hypothetical protein